MLADSIIAQLDAELAEVGEDVVLRRTTGTAPNVANIDVVCRAFVRSWRLKEEDLASGISQALILVTMSPTQINNAQWPGGSTPGQSVDPTIPRRLDQVIVKGRIRDIEAVDPLMVGGEVVRIDMQVLG